MVRRTWYCVELYCNGLQAFSVPTGRIQVDSAGQTACWAHPCSNDARTHLRQRICWTTVTTVYSYTILQVGRSSVPVEFAISLSFWKIRTVPG